MLTCVPQSLCSWDFRVLGASANAALTFDFFTEQGGISLGQTELAVRKHGPLSGHWTLERDGMVAIDANKPNALFRSFDLSAGAIHFTLKAQSPITRCYEILSDNQIAGTICPVHPFTRRAVIECNPTIPEIAQLFSFWLAVITWRRAARNNSSGAGA